MTAGFEVRADTGNVSVDHSFFNYAFIAKYSLAFNNQNLASITYSGVAPVVAIYSTNGLVAIRNIDKNANGSLTAWFISDGNASTAEAYVFDRVPQQQSANFGFQAFDASGALIFDSGRKYLSVVAFAFANQGVSGLPNAKYGFCYGSIGVTFVQVAGGFAQAQIPCYRSSLNGIVAQSIPYMNFPSTYLGMQTTSTICVVNLNGL